VPCSGRYGIKTMGASQAFNLAAQTSQIQNLASIPLPCFSNPNCRRLHPRKQHLCLAKRSNSTCQIIKDSLWHYIVTIPSNGHRGCSSALLDNIGSTGYQPQDWGARPLANRNCKTSFALPAGTADAVNRGFQAAFGGTAGC